MENLDLPHRFRESSFRDYEQWIANICTMWPSAIKIDPKHFGRSQTTISCRLRDAIKSLHDNGWNTFVDKAKFDTIWDKVVVSERTDGSVLAGSKQGIEQFTTGTHAPTSFPVELLSNKDIVVDTCKSGAELLAILSQAGKLAPRLHINNLTDYTAEQLQKSYDISLDKQPDGTYILI